MTRELLIACAGAGKSTIIVSDALLLSKLGTPSIILTYTESNQRELKKKFEDVHGCLPSNIDIKGWYSFLLEDIIRPYQKCLLSDRINGLNFNKNGDPHKSNGRSIPGTAEKISLTRHFTVSNGTRVHSTYISKLASRIIKKSKSAPLHRLSKIYGALFVDEVQDLTGWDYEVVAAMSKSSISKICTVGDFRQTVYQTHKGTKQPVTATQKRAKFKAMNFAEIPISGSWRCDQTICDISDLIHVNDGYEKTLCKIDRKEHPLPEHFGVFSISRSMVSEYIVKYKPAILRLDKNKEQELCNGQPTFNFGVAKGLQFDRVLIIPTNNQKKFLLGDRKPLDSGKTDKARNVFYVALTRARHSVVILMEEKSVLNGIGVYTKEPLAEDGLPSAEA